MCVSEILSVTGDQLSRVGVTLVAFSRTDSAALTGLVYALTYLPNVLGALFFSSVGDRRPRREVLVGIDAVRVVSVAAMAVSSVPLPVLCLLVAVGSFLNGPYKAVRLALLSDVLTAEQYGAGMAVRQSANQVAQLAGFALGGLVSSAFGPRLCFVLDAVTFAAAAVLVRAYVRFRPAAATPAQRRSVLAGLRVVWGEQGRRAIFLSTFSGLFLVAPEGVVAPYVDGLGLGSAWVGYLLAGAAAFSILGLALFTRLVPERSRPSVFPFVCLAAGTPLLLVALGGGPYLALAAFGLSSALWSVQVVLSVSFLAAMLPAEQRSQGMGVAAATNLTAAGLGTALMGVIGQATGPATAIALAGGGCILFALWPGTLWMRRATNSDVPRGTSDAAVRD
ncbi:MFS transporter [Streptomyces sp. NPDC056656]|uniref:MFS transporter n=1 Tax=Streptomyces sp. NPDC056656 TaxID=3345895 RepID=UPI0036B1B5F8